MFRFHKALWGILATVLSCAAIYCVVGGRPEEATWAERLRASGGFLAFALLFAAGFQREFKLEREEKAKKEPIQPPETTRGK